MLSKSELLAGNFHDEDGRTLASPSLKLADAVEVLGFDSVHDYKNSYCTAYKMDFVFAGHLTSAVWSFKQEILEVFRFGISIKELPRERYSIEERQLVGFYNQWLSEMFGDIAFNRQCWGEIWACYDEREGASEILVKYRRKQNFECCHPPKISNVATHLKFRMLPPT